MAGFSRLETTVSSSLMCPTIRRRAKAAECKKACKKFKAMTMKAGKRRRQRRRRQRRQWRRRLRRAAREAEEKEGRRRSTSFFLPCLRFLCTQEFGGHFFFAFAHFLLYTKDPDLLQALDLPVMPASAAGEAARDGGCGDAGGASAYCCSRPKSP